VTTEEINKEKFEITKRTTTADRVTLECIVARIACAFADPDESISGADFVAGVAELLRLYKILTEEK
jgi:hypothetical protein